MASERSVASEGNAASGNVASDCDVREECGVRERSITVVGNVASECGISVRAKSTTPYAVTLPYMTILVGPVVGQDLCHISHRTASDLIGPHRTRFGTRARQWAVGWWDGAAKCPSSTSGVQFHSIPTYANNQGS